MKHFLYTIATRKRRGVGYRDQHLKLYILGRGGPQFLGNYRFHHESETQAAYNAIAAFAPLPKRVRDAEAPMGGRDWAVWSKYCTVHNLSHTEVDWD